MNIARKYSVPVILLTDQAIATRIEAFEEPDLKAVCQELAPSMEPVESCKPYDLTAPEGVASHVPPELAFSTASIPL